MNSIASIVVGAPVVETTNLYPGLTITASGEISVFYSYGSTADSIPAGTSQTIYAPQGTNITLTARPSFFIYSFAGWTGATTSSKGTIHMILNSPLSLTANYSFNYISIRILSAIVVAAVVVVLVLTRRSRVKSSSTHSGEDDKQLWEACNFISSINCASQ